MYFDLDKSFIKDASKISQQCKRQLSSLFVVVEFAKNIHNIPNVKKLIGHSSAYRIRLGQYRIGVYLEKDTIIFSRILHRKDIYQKFP